jgi:hypothetical protein
MLDMRVSAITLLGVLDFIPQFPIDALDAGGMLDIVVAAERENSGCAGDAGAGVGAFRPVTA